MSTWPGLLEARLALTRVKYYGNLLVLLPLNQRLVLTRLRTTGPSAINPGVAHAQTECPSTHGRMTKRGSRKTVILPSWVSQPSSYTRYLFFWLGRQDGVTIAVCHSNPGGLQFWSILIICTFCSNTKLINNKVIRFWLYARFSSQREKTRVRL